LRVRISHHIAILLALGLTLISVACSNSNPSADLQKEVKTIISWIETTRAVGEAWKSGWVPSAYTGRTLQTAQENLKQEIKNIRSLSIPEQSKAEFSIKVQQLEYFVGQGVQAVGDGDKSALDEALTQLAIAQRSLSSSTK
jgi:ABC-type glycerol-3-phosphate transport system substrate-binding protein